MRRALATGLAALALALALAAALPPASPAAVPDDPDLALANLRLTGSQGWRPENGFHFTWTTTAPSKIAGYRFLNVPWDTAEHEAPYLGPGAVDIAVPPPPGAATPPPDLYRLELWAYAELKKRRGPGVVLQLPFDPTVPPPAQPSAPAGWIGDRDPILVKIAQPGGTPSPSGLYGYAVSLTPSPDDSPCADPERCAPGEVDLVGAGNDELRLGPLPEGVDYVHVAAVSGAGVASATRSVAIRIDARAPEIRFAGIPAGWVDHPVQVSALAVDAVSGTAAGGPNGPFTALAIDGGVPTTAFGGAATATVAGEGVHSLSGWARDLVGNTGAPTGGAGALVRIDETPPRAAFAAAQLPEDPELIRVGVADVLSGPSGERGAIGVRPAGSGESFAPLPTAVGPGGGLSARWSSDDFPPGPYEFRAVGFDAAGNSAASASRTDGAPMVLRNPIKLPTRIASGFGGARLVWQRCHRADGGRRCQRETVTGYEKRPTLRTVPYGRPLRFGGVLLDAAGRPLAHQPVEVVETFSAGADAAGRRTTVLTGAEGGFGTRLAPGPSRRVEARFAGTRTLTRAAGAEVGMAVRAGLRFRASTEAAEIGGRPVVFSGRLLDDEAAIPRTGRPIGLEFRVPGGTWSEFRTVQTDHRGRFRYPYAFTDDDSSGIRFQFRAVSPEQSGWPYRPAASAPVAVTGH